MKLCQVIASLSQKDGHIDALELRDLFADKEEWDFAIKRLVDLGMAYWLDLSPSEQECAQAAAIAMERITNQEALKAEIDMIFAPMRCVAGSPIRVIPENSVADMGYFDGLKEPAFNSNSIWVTTECGPAFLVDENDTRRILN